MLPRIPELMVAALGVWRAGAVYMPMFTAFGPKAIEYRLERSAAKLIVTDPTNRPKLDDVANAPPIMVVARAPDDAIVPGDLEYHHQLAAQAPAFEPVLRGADDPFLLMFTSGTVGSPKGVAIPHKALLSFIAYMKYAVDLRPEDKFWNMADPGWAYGLYYAVVGAPLIGNATHFYEGAFSVESTYEMLEKYAITVFCSAPTAYRLLMAGGDAAADACQAPIRVACSCGEPLNPEVIRWVNDHLGCPVHDQYGQTEVAVVVTNHHVIANADEIKVNLPNGETYDARVVGRDRNVVGREQVGKSGANARLVLAGEGPAGDADIEAVAGQPDEAGDRRLPAMGSLLGLVDGARIVVKRHAQGQAVAKPRF